MYAYAGTSPSQQHRGSSGLSCTHPSCHSRSLVEKRGHLMKLHGCSYLPTHPASGWLAGRCKGIIDAGVFIHSVTPIYGCTSENLDGESTQWQLDCPAHSRNIRARQYVRDASSVSAHHRLIRLRISAKQLSICFLMKTATTSSS
eukprot:GHVU01070089.1.p2 GENE.GHVU01070089.1~~GHVU01070089.1.p2  ORF type:complete len:145 (-),score=0.10 GHVU01070089.1:1173-1607(-)